MELSWCVDELNVAIRHGRIVRKVRESYLRDELSCSLPDCTLCSDVSASTLVLGMTKTLLADTPHDGVYLLPSMKTCLLQMDLFELSTKEQPNADTERHFLDDIVVLETVLEFVKRQDLAVYNRLRALIMNSDRRFVAFANEHHRACFVQKRCSLPKGYQEDTLEDNLPFETEEERNERAVAIAWKWYSEHLTELHHHDVKVSFLANDTEDLKHAEKFGVIGGQTIEDFLQPVAVRFPELQSLVSTSAAKEKKLMVEGVSCTAECQNKKQLYPDYLSETELLAGGAAYLVYKKGWDRIID